MRRKRETAKPTAEVVWELFFDRVLLVFTPPGGGEVRRLQGLAEAQLWVLDMLGIEKEALTERKNREERAGDRGNVSPRDGRRNSHS